MRTQKKSQERYRIQETCWLLSGDCGKYSGRFKEAVMARGWLGAAEHLQWTDGLLEVSQGLHAGGESVFGVPDD